MQQTIVFLTLGLALILFAWGKLRYEVVALLALFVLVVSGIIPADDAFAGFGHPAVITVAAVLLISHGLQQSGLVDLVAGFLAKAGKGLLVQIIVLCVIVALASAFMNNIGALAILMPVALHLARRSNNPPSYVLMPIAFASILGGMMTLIGTPPNIIVATFRAEATGAAFGMFDFTPVGLSVAVAGLLFITLVGWRLLPKREPQESSKDLFEIENYITEVRITKDSKLKGMTFGEIDEMVDGELMALGLVRKKVRMHAPSPSEELKTNDILILEADTETLKSFIDETGVKLVGGKQFRKDAKGSEDIEIMEAVVMAGSPLIDKTAASLQMRTRFGLNLLAVARREKQIRRRIDKVRFEVGDVLLLQGRSINIQDAITAMNCLPLAERDLKIGKPRQVIVALAIFVAAIATVVAGLLPVQIAFAMAAVTMIISKILPLKDVYKHIDWPVIVLLGAMIPVGDAFETSGGADLITRQMVALGQDFPVWVLLGTVMILTMFLSDLINNAATVVLMAPIAIKIAETLTVSADAFLMAVAVGGSCAFLTPIGHQSNTLVMGPGGYRFSDYWKMGLPLEVIIIAAGVPLILLFWPL